MHQAHSWQKDEYFPMKGRKAEIEVAAATLGDGEEADQLGLALASPNVAVADVLNEPAAAVAVRRGRGRPPGARNRRTSEMVAYVERVLGEPLLVKAVRIVGADVRLLAKGLGCTKIEAAKLQVQVLLGALPYLHQRLPLAVDVQARQAVALAVHVGLGEGAAGSLDEAVDRAATVLDLLPDAPEGSEQYQGLGDGRTGDV